MVSAKLSMVWMGAVTAGVSARSVLSAMAQRKRMANQGMTSLRCPEVEVLLLERANQLKQRSTGTSMMTRIILTITATSATSLPMALEAPTTCATSWTVEPV